MAAAEIYGGCLKKEQVLFNLINKGLWYLIFLLAILVGVYALLVVFVTGFRTPFVIALFDSALLGSYLHLIGGGVVIIVGAAQFSQKLRVSKPSLHRLTGYVYIIGVVLGSLSAFYLALKSSGGLAAHYGFGALAVLWLGSTITAYYKIRQRDFAAHQRWMIRSYALTLAALTLRIYLPVALMSGLRFEEVYPLIAWLCWVPNLLITDWLILPKLRSQTA